MTTVEIVSETSNETVGVKDFRDKNWKLILREHFS